MADQTIEIPLNRFLRAVLPLLIIGLLMSGGSIFAEEDPGLTASPEAVQGFLDEDGDGFNDLLPDRDGDGVPDVIDPDFKGHKAESLYMHRYMQSESPQFQQGGGMMGMGEMEHHGEPGQYGPNDTTGHGGMHGGGGHMGEHEGGGGGGMTPAPDPNTAPSQPAPVDQKVGAGKEKPVTKR